MLEVAGGAKAVITSYTGYDYAQAGKPRIAWDDPQARDDWSRCWSTTRWRCSPGWTCRRPPPPVDGPQKQVNGPENSDATIGAALLDTDPNGSSRLR